ncbi:MAG: hypothetical protein IT163_08160 [Bryobacterales bacterium]|nr:hypothetical protein [Bryobacterales bacterium]
MRLLAVLLTLSALAAAAPEGKAPFAKAPLGQGWFPIVIVEVIGPGQAPGWTAVDVVEAVRGDHIEGRWQASLGAFPARPGDRLLLFYARSRDSGRIIFPQHTFEANEENVRFVRTHMAAGPRTRWIQFPLLVLAILGAPLAGLTAIIFRKPRVGLWGLAAALAAALAYETGVPKNTSVRADWLLITPALCGAALMVAVSHYLRRRATTSPSSPRDPR